MISLPLTITHSVRFVNSAALDAARPVWYTESMNEKLRPVISIRIFRETKCFGPGVAELLRHVREAHSLRGAAMTMGMAYSKAWTITKHAQAALGFPLLPELEDDSFSIFVRVSVVWVNWSRLAVTLSAPTT